MNETKKEILAELEKLLDEAVRLYEVNGRAPFEAGRVDGIKWAIEKIRGI